MESQWTLDSNASSDDTCTHPTHPLAADCSLIELWEHGHGRPTEKDDGSDCLLLFEVFHLLMKRAIAMLCAA